MTDLLVAATTHPTTTAGQSLVVEEAQVEPSEYVDSRAWGALPVTEAPEEVTDTPLEGMDKELEMLAVTTVELLSNEEVEATMPSTLDEAKLEFLYGLGTKGAVEDPLAADGARVAGGVSSSGLPLSLRSCLQGEPLQILI